MYGGLEEKTNHIKDHSNSKKSKTNDKKQHYVPETKA